MLRLFFELIKNQSPFAIEQYRQRGLALAAAGDRQVATAFSALEQAQWDLVEKALGGPVYELFGDALRHQGISPQPQWPRIHRCVRPSLCRHAQHRHPGVPVGRSRMAW